MASPSYFDLLGVARDASEDEIRAAYRAAARTAHPDVGGSTEEFQQLQEALQVLCVPQQRELYTAELLLADMRTLARSVHVSRSDYVDAVGDVLDPDGLHRRRTGARTTTTGGRAAAGTGDAAAGTGDAAAGTAGGSGQGQWGRLDDDWFDESELPSGWSPARADRFEKAVANEIGRRLRNQSHGYIRRFRSPGWQGRLAGVAVGGLLAVAALAVWASGILDAFLWDPTIGPVTTEDFQDFALAGAVVGAFASKRVTVLRRVYAWPAAVAFGLPTAIWTAAALAGPAMPWWGVWTWVGGYWAVWHVVRAAMAGRAFDNRFAAAANIAATPTGPCVGGPPRDKVINEVRRHALDYPWRYEDLR